jgi:hypothetical protein
MGKIAADGDIGRSQIKDKGDNVRRGCGKTKMGRLQ